MEVEIKHTTTILLWVILAAAEVQSQQESECYAWAVKTTVLDPFDLSKQAQKSAEQAAVQQQAAEEKGKGTAAKGAVAGAAAGALIGEIASDDPGQGAAWGDEGRRARGG